jgi:hypothetical protein
MAFLDRAYFLSVIDHVCRVLKRTMYSITPILWQYGMLPCSDIAVILTSHLSLAWQGCMENEFMRTSVRLFLPAFVTSISYGA